MMNCEFWIFLTPLFFQAACFELVVSVSRNVVVGFCLRDGEF